jgi:hypothetical protein
MQKLKKRAATTLGKRSKKISKKKKVEKKENSKDATPGNFLSKEECLEKKLISKTSFDELKAEEKMLLK